MTASWTDSLQSVHDGDGAEATVHVRRVLVPPTDTESWTVTTGGGALVDPIEAFLAHLSNVERSPNTVRAYAYDLRDLFVFLESCGVDWQDATAEDVGRFVAWLRLPRGATPGTVVALPTAPAARSLSTVSRKLAAVSSFYDFHQRRGVAVSSGLWGVQRGRPSSGTSWKPFLHHLGPRERQVLAVRVKPDRQTVKDMPAESVDAVLAACTRRRDLLLFTILRDTGLRIGEALGLRHEDIDSPHCRLWVRRRTNANGVRAKSHERCVPIPRSLVRCYSDYLHDEYGDLDSDYVFVTASGPRAGQALRYEAVHDLVGRLRRRSGVEFHPHQFRHTYATDLLRRGVPVEVVQMLLGHASYATTADTYAHLKIEDARRHLERVGWFADREEPR